MDCSANYRGPIDLVLTDVAMPGMTVGQLGQQIRQRHPSIRVLYMIGYAEDEVVHEGPIDPPLAILRKPFTAQTLTQKVRQIMDVQTKSGFSS